MGAVISYFRRAPKTLEDQLEELEKKIYEIHEFTEATEYAMKKIIGTIVFYGWILIIFGGVLSYFYIERTFRSGLICLSPLVLAPFVLMGSKKVLQGYYSSRLSNKQEELRLLNKEKKALINKVKETETYKKAEEILEKFDPDRKMKRAQADHQRDLQRTVLQTGEGGLRKPQSVRSGNGLDIRHRPVGTPIGAAVQQRLGNTAPNTPFRNSQRTLESQFSSFPSTPTPYIKTTPRPILPQNRGVMEKVVDFIAGEGPNNRFALICKSCQSHNGMALSEEFEYLSYRCCYCGHFNHSRKQRPAIPPHNLSKANSTVSLNDISRSGSPTPSGPLLKDSDQESDASRVNDENLRAPLEQESPESARDGAETPTAGDAGVTVDAPEVAAT